MNKGSFKELCLLNHILKFNRTEAGTSCKHCLMIGKNYE